MTVSEDTPPDMLAGQMVLKVILPSGARVKMSISRRTPMMDLLVQVTTANKLSPAAHVLQPYGESGLLPYKPSTPIGTLDTWTVHVVPKLQAGQKSLSDKSKQSLTQQPFEQTFRLQAYLPRNQMYVTRVSGKTTLGQVLREACDEKNLDPSKYSIRHPKNLDEPLSEQLTLTEYRHNQVCIVSNKTLPSSVSSEDIITMHQYNNSNAYPSRESSRSLSPDSSMSPQQPARPVRKRRPAPKPPVQPQNLQIPPAKNDAVTNNNTVICHSRTSSDSSGYHEASVLSESPDSNNSLPDSLPRRSKLTGVEMKSATSSSSLQLSRSLSNLHAASSATLPAKTVEHHPRQIKTSQSTSSLAAIPSRKKKPAPAPPVKMSAVLEERYSSGPGEEPAQPGGKSSTLPARARPPSSECSVESESRAPESREGTTARGTSRARAPPVPAPRRLPQPEEEEEEEEEANPEGMERKLNSELDLHRRDSDQSPKTSNIRSVESTGDLANLEKTLVQPPPKKWPSVDDLTDEMELTMADEEIDRIFNNATKDHTSLESGMGEDIASSPESGTMSGIRDSPPLPPQGVDLKPRAISELYIRPPSESFPELERRSPESTDPTSRVLLTALPSPPMPPPGARNRNSLNDLPPEDLELDWEYKLPAPPTFRDEVTPSPSYTEYGTVTIANLSDIIYREPDKENKVVSERTTPPPTIHPQQPVSNRESSFTNHRTAVLNELSNVINERRNKLGATDAPDSRAAETAIKTSSTLNNFKITTYESARPVLTKQHSENDAVTTTAPTVSVVRRSSFTGDEKRGSLPIFVKRSVSHVSLLAKSRISPLSKSNADLLETVDDETDSFPEHSFGEKQRFGLRKTYSEFNIDLKSTTTQEKKVNFEQTVTGLQSLLVLRTILPQISQSQGAMESVGTPNAPTEKSTKEPPSTGGGGGWAKPAVSFSTWGERPKRQVSIKSDRDYVFGTKKNEESPKKPALHTTKVDIVSPVKEDKFGKRNSANVYRTMETGNTRPLKKDSPTRLGAPPPETSRIPVVRSVELKPPYRSEAEIPRGVSDLALRFAPPAAPPAPPAAAPPVLRKAKGLPPPREDPRERLLDSIRAFGGRANLRKVSAR